MSFSRSARWTLGVVLASVLVSYAASALTWEMTTGPYGGTVYCLWQAENGVVYAGTDSGELYRSESRGESWSYMATVSDRSILSMAIKNNVFYIGTDGAGVWRSLDEGKTWEEMDRLSLLNPTVRALVVYHDKLYAASTGGTSRLHEQNLAEGLQPVWEPLLGGLRNVNLRDYLIHNDSLYAASHQGVFRFDEGRGTWSQYREGLEDGRGSFHMVRDIAHSGSAFIAATATGGAFISTAEPKWTAANNGLRSSDLTLPAPNVLSLAASPGNMLAGVAGEGVFRSTDGGATWKESSQGMANRYAMTLLDLGDRVLAGTFGSGVYRSDNGGASWVDSSDGIRDTSVFDMTASGSRLVVGTSGGIYASDDGGVTWRAVNDGLANLNLRNLGAMGGDKLYAGTYRSAFHVSTDNGATWTPQTSVEFNGTTARAAISADGLELLGTAGRGIYLSKDGGATWTASNTGIAFPFIVALKKIGGRIFAGTDGRGVYVSDDNGASWVDVSTGIAKGYAFGFAEIDGRAFVGTFGSGVYELVGDTWQSRNAGLTDVDVRSLIAVGQTLYAATAENGVFVSTDGGATWNPANDGLEHLRARVLLALNGFLYVGTARDGVYRAKLP